MGFAKGRLQNGRREGDLGRDAFCLGCSSSESNPLSELLESISGKMELLPMPVLAELMAMLPYQDFVRFERVCKALRRRITQNASFSASFVNLRFNLPADVRLLQASFAELKQVLWTLYGSTPGLCWTVTSRSRLLTVNQVPAEGKSHTFCYSLGETAQVITSLSLYQPRGNGGLTVLLLASLRQLPQPQVEEYASLFAQADNAAAISVLEQAGLVRVVTCFDFEQDWKCLTFQSSSDLRPVFWLHLSPDFTETFTLDLSRPILARCLYIYPLNATCRSLYLSARGAALNFVAS